MALSEGVCINTTGSPRLGLKKAPDQSHTGHAPQRHGPPWVVGRENAGPQRLWPHVQWQLLFQAEVLKSADLLGVPLVLSFPLARLLRGPCPHTPLQPLANAVLRVHPDAGRGVRDVGPEWHWGTMRGT